MGSLDYSRIWWRSFRTPIGWISVAADHEGILRVHLRRRVAATGAAAVPAGIRKTLERAERQILAFLAGRRRSFDLPTRLAGTPFQLRVWSELKRIPYGKRRTYGQIARRIGRPGAARAVGGACGKNPLRLLVPCHRVVGSRGLGGFAGGPALKAELLDLEKP